MRSWIIMQCLHPVEREVDEIAPHEIDTHGFLIGRCPRCEIEHLMEEAMDRKKTDELVARLRAKKIPTKGVMGLCRTAARTLENLALLCVEKMREIEGLRNLLEAKAQDVRHYSDKAGALANEVTALQKDLEAERLAREADAKPFVESLEAKSKLIDDSIAVNNALVAEVQRLQQPIPLIMKCPECGTRHIDVGRFETEPHTTHACQECGHVWRPAIVPTVGVRFLPGCKNTADTVAS